MESLTTPQHNVEYAIESLEDDNKRDSIGDFSLEKSKDEVTKPVEKPDNMAINGHVGAPLSSLGKVQKVKLEISCGPSTLPVRDYEPLQYGRRKRRLHESTKRVKLILSSKRIHPGTKTNGLYEPEIHDKSDGETESKNVPKYRRKQASFPFGSSILDAFTNAFDDNEDGFTTIKDLAERGITKMEPLDFDDFYQDNGEDYADDIVKDENDDPDFSPPAKVKDEPDLGDDHLEDDEDMCLSDLRKTKPAKKKRGKRAKISYEEDLTELKDEEEANVNVKKRRKKRAQAAPGYGPAPDNKVYTCQYCEFSAKKAEWLSHLKKEHTDKNLVFCPVKKCQKPFESKELMEEHEQNTHIKNICTFEGCGKEFKFRSVLREHRKTHYPADCDWMADPDPDMTIDRFFVCTYCGKRYRTRTGWRAHEAYRHTKQLDFNCDEEGCDKAFFCESELVIHKRKHSGELPFTCSYCGNRYISAHSLAQHEKASHLQTEDVECEVCNKKVRRRNLPAHVKTHSEFKGLPCKFCTKEFPTIGSLKRHEKIHMDMKEHKCSYCGKGFVQKANMQAHERIHTGERPFKCQFCNEGFVQLTRRKQHEATCKMRKISL